MEPDQDFDPEAQRRFERWKDLNEIAQRTRRQEDAMAAGSAWGKFLEQFDKRKAQ